MMMIDDDDDVDGDEYGDNDDDDFPYSSRPFGMCFFGWVFPKHANNEVKMSER